MKTFIRVSAIAMTVMGFFMGCATSGTTASMPAPIPALSPQTSTEQTETPENSFPGIQMTDIQPFAERVQWPESPTDKPTFNVASGTGDDVWIEGKGYFRGSLDDVYKDFIDVMIIGPTHMTQNIVRDNFVEEELKTSYVMHVKMKYILTIEFDLSATLQPLFEGTEQTGWLYHSEKTDGTRFIKMISDTIVIKKQDNGWYSVEMLSLNRAAQDKEEEARGHVEGLFSYWNEASNTRIYTATPATETTTENTSEAAKLPSDDTSAPTEQSIETASQTTAKAPRNSTE